MCRNQELDRSVLVTTYQAGSQLFTSHPAGAFGFAEE
jgi:hypothetical protein